MPYQQDKSVVKVPVDFLHWAKTPRGNSMTTNMNEAQIPNAVKRGSQDAKNGCPKKGTCRRSSGVWEEHGAKRSEDAFLFLFLLFLVFHFSFSLLFSLLFSFSVFIFCFHFLFSFSVFILCIHFLFSFSVFIFHFHRFKSACCWHPPLLLKKNTHPRSSCFASCKTISNFEKSLSLKRNRHLFFAPHKIKVFHVLITATGRVSRFYKWNHIVSIHSLEKLAISRCFSRPFLNTCVSGTHGEATAQFSATVCQSLPHQPPWPECSLALLSILLPIDSSPDRAGWKQDCFLLALVLFCFLLFFFITNSVVFYISMQMTFQRLLSYSGILFLLSALNKSQVGQFY